MGYTNKTSHYDLPQWIAGVKPSWLGDVNTAMLNIDTAIAGADASASAAESSAAAANAQVQAQEAKITKNTTDIQALTENLADTQGEVNNVKTTAEAALPKSGGTMSGNLILNAAPTEDLQAATKKYVDGVGELFVGSAYGDIEIYIKKVGSVYFVNGYCVPNQDISAATVVAQVNGDPFEADGLMILGQCGVDLDSPPASRSNLINPSIKYNAATNKTELSLGGLTANHHYFFAG